MKKLNTDDTGLTEKIRIDMELLHRDITDNIIKSFYCVYNELGFGFLEKVYENSLFLEFLERGLYCEKQKRIKVFFKGQKVGEYYADLIINNLVIIEIKAAESFAREHELQLVNYLKATDIEVGMLLNFGKKPEFKRKIFTNDKKKTKSDFYSFLSNSL